jgi:hypothetical protein
MLKAAGPSASTYSCGVTVVLHRVAEGRRRKHRAENRKQKQKAESRELRAESREREQRAESREQRAES